jgi:hypothetical protein
MIFYLAHLWGAGIIYSIHKDILNWNKLHSIICTITNTIYSLISIYAFFNFLLNGFAAAIF